MTPSPLPPRRPGWFRWRVLLSPFRTRHPGTMPAGMVLVVVMAGLVVAGALNADATLRKSNAKGDGWRNDMAHIVAGAADAVGLTSLRRGVDDALGKNQSTDVDVAELLAQQQAQDPSLLAAEAEQARLAALTPTLPPATPEAPLRMWIGGDSIARAFGQAMETVAASTGVLSPTLDFRPASGLSRPDFFNWPEHLVRDVVPTDPQIMVLQFGANDAQGFTVDGRSLTRFTDEWLAEYRRRVAATMDLLRSPTNQRLVVWVAAPIMGPDSKVAGMEKLNAIYWDEARTRPWVTYVDTWPFLTDANLQYVDEAPNANGRIVDLRDTDQVHFSRAGGTRVAWVVLDRIAQHVDLRAGAITPPPGDAPPPGLVARTELPPPA